MKKIFTLLLSSLLALGMTKAVGASEANLAAANSVGAKTEASKTAEANDSEDGADIYHYYGEIEYSFVYSARISKASIVGEVIGGVGVTDGNWYELACDGDVGTRWNGDGDLYDMWVGIKTDEPAVVKCIKLATQDDDGDGRSDRRHAIWGGRVQGSNDGIEWEDIHVITYEEYDDYDIDAKSTYLTVDVSDNETAYTFFRYINNGDGVHALAELQLFNEVEQDADEIVYPAYPAYDYLIFTDEYPELGVAFGENYPGSTAAGIPECTTGTLMKGLVAVSVNDDGIFAWNGLETRYNPEHAFDGINTTFFYAFNQSSMYHPILILEEAYELTEVRLFTYPSAAVPTTDHLIQGSNDGVNWVTVIHIPEITTDSYVVFTPEAHNYEGYIDYSDAWVGGGSYSMYRYINTNGTTYNGISDIEFYGIAKEATAVTPDMIVEPELSVNRYPYEMDITDKTSSGAEGSLVGTVIGGSYGWNGHNYEHAFDNKTRTYFDPNYSSPISWVGLKMDAPTVLTGVKLYPVNQQSELSRLRRVNGSFVQGSNDGINWTTLIAYGVEDIPASGEWVEKTCESTEAYIYFRYVNNGFGHAEAAELLFFGETYVPAKFDLVDAAAAAGDTVEVEIIAATTVPVDSVTLYELTYDPEVLTFVEFTGFGESVTGSVTGTDSVDNEQKTIAFTLEGAAAIEGLVAKIKFTVNENAAVGTTEVIMTALVKNGDAVIDAVVDGAVVTVDAAYTPGDIDGSGLVDIQDALYLFQSTLMPELYPVNYAGATDFTGDGSTDIQDALYLFQHSMMPDLYPIV